MATSSLARKLAKHLSSEDNYYTTFHNSFNINKGRFKEPNDQHFRYPTESFSAKLYPADRPKFYPIESTNEVTYKYESNKQNLTNDNRPSHTSRLKYPSLSIKKEPTQHLDKIDADNAGNPVKSNTVRLPKEKTTLSNPSRTASSHGSNKPNPANRPTVSQLQTRYADLTCSTSACLAKNVSSDSNTTKMKTNFSTISGNSHQLDILKSSATFSTVRTRSTEDKRQPVYKGNNQRTAYSSVSRHDLHKTPANSMPSHRLTLTQTHRPKEDDCIAMWFDELRKSKPNKLKQRDTDHTNTA